MELHCIEIKLIFVSTILYQEQIYINYKRSVVNECYEFDTH